MTGHVEGGSGTLPGRKLLKLIPLGINQVPHHPDLQAEQANPPALSAFIAQCLQEAHEEDFSGFTKTGQARETVVSEGRKWPVVIEKLKKRDDVEGTWFARRSLHEEVTFEELDGLLRQDHERNEMLYTPAIYDVNTVLAWQVGEQIEGVKNVELRITQMHHTMPAPALLNDRVFTVLLVSFTPTPFSTGTQSQAIDFQLPIDLSTFPAAIKERSHVVQTPNSSKLVYKAPASPTAYQQKQDGRKLVEGRYVSIEKVSKVEVDGKTVGKWEMATNSDAEGALPMGLQKLGVPAAIVKDVTQALAYIVRQRGHTKGSGA